MSTATIEQPTAATPEAENPVVRFRRNAKKEWVLFGPADLVVEGPVTVTKKDGKTTVEIVLGLGGAFDNDGVPYRYGYLKPKADDAVKPAKPTSSDSEANYVPDDFVPDYEDQTDDDF